MRPTENDVSCSASVSHGQGQQTTGHYSWLQQNYKLHSPLSIIANKHKWFDRHQFFKCQLKISVHCNGNALCVFMEKFSNAFFYPWSQLGLHEVKSFAAHNQGSRGIWVKKHEYMYCTPCNNHIQSCRTLSFQSYCDIIHSFLTLLIKAFLFFNY